MTRCKYLPLLLCVFSRVRLFAILLTVALQAPLTMGFSRQEYWSGLLCPPPGDLPNPGIELPSPAFLVDSLLLSHLCFYIMLYLLLEKYNYGLLPPEGLGKKWKV